MEGPSLVIAREELAPFLKKKIKNVQGSSSTIAYEKLKNSQLVRVRTWGKHLILIFPKIILRIHFLMFGSYRIDNPRENRIPKLELTIGKSKIYFYSCAIKEITRRDLADYDEKIDLMSLKWDKDRALKSLTKHSSAVLCDIMMDQKIFAGLGNIMKNEILFLLKLHPETKLSALSLGMKKKLIKACHDYSWQFYEWKKANVLKRNWQVMRKKTCPDCKSKIIKRPTGELARISHFCKNCQKIMK